MRWFVWALVAVICWGAWALIARLIGDAISPAQSQSLSTLGLLPVIALLIFPVRKQAAGTTKWRGVILGCAAGVLTCLGIIAYYYVLNSGTKAATVVPLTALYPLVTVLLALVFLHERLNKIQIAGVCLSLAAIYAFNIKEEQGVLSRWLMLALLAIILWGVSGFAQKLSTNHVSGELSALSFLGVFVPIAIIILL